MPIESDLNLLAPITFDELLEYADDLQQTNNQAQLKKSLGAAVTFCQSYTGRSLVPEGDDTPVTKTAIVTRPRDQWVLPRDTVNGDVRQRVRVPDVRTIASLTINATSVDASGYTLEPDGYGRPAPILLLTNPWDRGATLSITGTFGFSDVPFDIRDAVYTDALRRYRNRDAGYADQVATPDGAVLAYFRTLPPQVQATYQDMKVLSDVSGLA